VLSSYHPNHIIDSEKLCSSHSKKDKLIRNKQNNWTELSASLGSGKNEISGKKINLDNKKKENITRVKTRHKSIENHIT